MKIVFLFAMREEANALDMIVENIKWKKEKAFTWAKFSVNSHDCIAVISGVGISLSAAACALSLDRYEPDICVNVGLAGGINCNVGDIIISQSAIFHDADVTALGYPKNQLPDLPRKITSHINYIEKLDLAQFIKLNDKALVLSGNQFIANKKYVEDLKQTYPDAYAIEMEAASIAAICSQFNTSFLFIKKISDLADRDAPESFNKETPNFNQKINKILLHILR